MAIPTGAIMAALIARYRGNAPLQVLLGNPANPPGAIYDGAAGIPTNTPMPYVAVYVPTSQIGTTLAMGQDATDSYVQINVFTRPGPGGGMKQARDIIGQIYAITNTKPVDLSASGFAQFFLLFQNEQEQEPKSDGLVPMIAHRYHLMTQSLT